MASNFAHFSFLPLPVPQLRPFGKWLCDTVLVLFYGELNLMGYRAYGGDSKLGMGRARTLGIDAFVMCFVAIRCIAFIAPCRTVGMGVPKHMVLELLG